MRRVGAGLMVSLLLIFPTATLVAKASDRTVAIGDDFFENQTIRVSQGATVTWKSRGLLTHTVTGDDAPIHSGDLTINKTFRRKFSDAGVYRYYCVYHGAPGGIGMSGIVLVGDAVAPGPPAVLSPRPQGPLTLSVPTDFATIQGAVDAAHPKDTVQIGPGVYEEAVVVRTPDITIRGANRHTVILDGEFRRSNGILVAADRVAVENMTARNYKVNGFYFSKVKGYRAAYVSAIRNGDYGLYAIESTNGRMDNVYAAGSPDGGIYIGACQPCTSIVTDSLAEYNELGFSGTNAGGDLLITRSEWRFNKTGILPNTLDSERNAPQRGAVIYDNYVHDNGLSLVPFKVPHYAVFGAGIALLGTEDNIVHNNRVENNSHYGILVMPSLDRNFWTAYHNRIEGNNVTGSGIADLALAAPAGPGNCFADNQFASSLPPGIEVLNMCDSALNNLGGGEMGVGIERIGRFALSLSDRIQPPDYRTMPDPPGASLLPSMLESPGEVGRTAATRRVPQTIPTKEVTLLGISVTPNPWMIFLGMYAYALPLALYATWMAVSVWDLARREDFTGAQRNIWLIATLAVPFGPALYLLLGKSPVARGFRITLVLGGLAVFVVLAALSALRLTV